VGLRLYRIDWQSVWHDEIFTIYACGRPLAELTRIVIGDYVHPPLHYYMLQGWFAVFGYGVLQARLMSLCFGVLAVGFTGLLGRTLFGRRAGLVAALLLAVSTSGVMYSQEARCYSQLLFLSVAAIYFFVTAARAHSMLRWSLFVLCALGAAYTHYLGVLTPAVLACFALVHRREYRIPASWWVGGLLLGLALYAPWVFSGAFELMYEGRKPLNLGRDSSISAKWFSLLACVNWFNNGKWFGVFQPTPAWLVGLGGLLFTLPAVYGSRSVLRRSPSEGVEGSGRRALVLLNALWLAPLVAIVLAGLLGLQFNVRYIVFLAAPYYVVAGKGLAELEPLRLRSLWILLVLIHSGIGLRAVYFLPFKEDYRAAVAYVAQRQRPDDCGVFLPARKWGSRPAFWYVYQRDSAPPRLVDASTAASEKSGCGRVWLVWDRTWWLNRQPASSASVKQALEGSLTWIGGARYFEMEVGLYEPKR
jgi:4-amino-4-deoxy-L-arabinose transferase-like glycosyltransferase